MSQVDGKGLKRPGRDGKIGDGTEIVEMVWKEWKLYGKAGKWSRPGNPNGNAAMSGSLDPVHRKCLSSTQWNNQE